jgi:glycosyltransferase involved in cell wall biosynthesis
MDKNLKTDTPLVTVNMPVYNAEKFIEDAITSLLVQSYNNIEIVIVDDGSTDNTLSIIKRFTDKRINLIQNHSNKGITYSRNLALENSNGEYIAIQDSDDISNIDRIKTQVDCFRKNPDLDIIATWADLITEKGEFTGESFVYDYSDCEVPTVLMFENCIIHSTVMIKSAILKKEKYDMHYQIAEDYQLWYRLASRYNYRILKKKLIKYRHHSLNISTERMHELLFVTRKIQLNLFNYLELQCTDEELLIFSYLNEDVSDFRDFSKGLKSLISKLLESNVKMHKFKPKLFKKLLFEKAKLIEKKAIFYNFVKQKRYDKKLLFKYLKSFSLIFFKVSIIQQFRFLYKCIIKFESN